MMTHGACSCEGGSGAVGNRTYHVGLDLLSPKILYGISTVGTPIGHLKDLYGISIAFFNQSDYGMRKLTVCATRAGPIMNVNVYRKNAVDVLVGRMLGELF